MKPPLRALTELALLEQIAPAAVLVNRNGDILYLHGRTGMYLELVPGEVGISNILKMAREGLRRDLTSALHKAASRGETVRCPGLRVKTNGDFTMVNLTVRAVEPGKPGRSGPDGSAGHEPMFLVILEEAQESEDSKQTTEDRGQTLVGR